MAEFRETFVVDASVADVAAIVCDVERWPSWTASMTSVRRDDDGPLKLGSTATVKQPRLPAGRWTVTKLDSTGFTWASSTPGVRSTGEHWARELPDGRTEVTLALVMTGPLAGILSRLYWSLIRRYVRTEAEGLQAELRRRAGSEP